MTQKSIESRFSSSDQVSIVGMGVLISQKWVCFLLKQAIFAAAGIAEKHICILHGAGMYDAVVYVIGD